jgi:beta-1,3-N-acetylgalactosaminyltransferase 2
MKTDDDCFVNIAEIITEITTYRKTPHKVWWGHFRENWYVERAGKWAEKHFKSSEYPSFACGSGNIVSKDISDWLTRNREDLFQYQGEDTSMGIWLSAIQPSYVNDKQWLCEKGCEKNALVVPQLSQDEIRRFWHDKVKCGNICGCK